MERGLLWLPLLGVFIGLAWSGWNEYQKVEAYRVWAKEFQNSKYDIFSVLGQKGTELTWGKPTRKGPVNLVAFSLTDVQSIRLLIDGQSVDLDRLPERGRTVELELQLKNSQVLTRIPFTEVNLAALWAKSLTEMTGLFSG
ncbi:MAG: hypothetical protein ACRC8A_11255 [Microcoleaceae cyanobacterium]